MLKEVVNEDIGEDQISVTLIGSDRLAATDASYVKYHLYYDGKNYFTNSMNIKDQSQTYFHRFQNVRDLKSLKDNDCSISLKKTGFLGLSKSTLDTANIKLSQLGRDASLTKNVTLQGAKLTVEIKINNAANKKQMAMQVETITTLGPLPKPFKGEEIVINPPQPAGN